MDLPTYFKDFLSNIRLTDSQTEELKKGHELLRNRLQEYDEISRTVITTFLQGSYRRGTSIRPKPESLADVDVVVVTNIDKGSVTPGDALKLFMPFLDKYYKGKYEIQGRSIGIDMSKISLDLVPTTSMASRTTLESGFFRSDKTIEDYEFKRLGSSLPLFIPNREVDRWEETDPIAQIDWTIDKNANCNGHYVNVVKALKWWRQEKQSKPKYPKSYPLEHLIGQCCPDGIKSVAEGVTKSLEGIKDKFAAAAQQKTTPFIPDHGVPSHNVLGRVSGEDFSAFHTHVGNAASLSRKAFDSADLEESLELWGQLFGDNFPDSGNGGDKGGGYTERKKSTNIGGSRWGK